MLIVRCHRQVLDGPYNVHDAYSSGLTIGYLVFDAMRCSTDGHQREIPIRILGSAFLLRKVGYRDFTGTSKKWFPIAMSLLPKAPLFRRLRIPLLKFSIEKRQAI
jgi:hypothetical protein